MPSLSYSAHPATKSRENSSKTGLGWLGDSGKATRSGIWRLHIFTKEPWASRLLSSTLEIPPSGPVSHNQALGGQLTPLSPRKTAMA